MQILSTTKITFTLEELSKIEEVADLLRDVHSSMARLNKSCFDDWRGCGLTRGEIDNTVDVLDAIVDGGNEFIIS